MPDCYRNKTRFSTKPALVSYLHEIVGFVINQVI